MKQKPINHGTIYAYQHRQCRCPRCRNKITEYTRERREINHMRMVRGEVKPKHGRPNTYVNYACRCWRCRKAIREQHADYRDRVMKAKATALLEGNS